jgi:serine phosphatase RsbU (regulator of sigma subunit)
VYGVGDNPYMTSSAKPVGVLSSVIQLRDTGKDSGMEAEAARLSISEDGDSAKKGASSNQAFISLQNKVFTGIEVLMVHRDGYVIFPLSKINDDISTLKPTELINGPWGPIVRAGQAATTRGQQNQIKASGHWFLTYSQKIDADWNIVAISDRDSALAKVYQQVLESAIRQLLVVGMITLVVVISCRKAAQPIQVAAAGVREFRVGNFDNIIVDNRNDEIGMLYDDINQTGKQLRALLNAKLAHAVTDKQIQIAADIQKEFIIQLLPSTDVVELAGDFDPAYEVGADWYDVIIHEDLTYVIIADVCDKGIPSALFMSVFQSLLHYALLKESKGDERSDAADILESSITQVNDYMSKRHGQSAIFATIFVGAYENRLKRLSYVCAGHESPLLIRARGVIEKLENSGPAVGIFPGSKYTAKSTDMNPGEMLFTYTDGLIDARNPEGEAWGIRRLETMLAMVEPAAMTATKVMTDTIEQVNEYRSGAEQFDDTTILIMKIKT